MNERVFLHASIEKLAQHSHLAHKQLVHGLKLGVTPQIHRQVLSGGSLGTLRSTNQGRHALGEMDTTNGHLCQCQL